MPLELNWEPWRLDRIAEHSHNLKYPSLGRCSQFFADQFVLISETCMVSAWRDRAEWLCEL